MRDRGVESLAKIGHLLAHSDKVDGARSADQEMVAYGMRYEPVQPYTREDAEAAFVRDDPDELNKVLLGLSWYEPDWRWVQEQCIRFSQHAHEHVRGVVPICFMHLARINRDLDVDAVFPILEALQNDPSPWVSGNAREYLADIKWMLFGIPVCLPSVTAEELGPELTVLQTLEWVSSILQDTSAPLWRPVPPSVSVERQLALYHETFERMRQHFALLGISDPEERSAAPDAC
jgi:hypothetical protein